MNLLWAVPALVLAIGLGVAALLIVRRRAPDGGYFEDGDRAAGVFGTLATGLAVLLGFVVFLAFESFDQSRTGAEREATIVAQQYETAQFMPAAVRDGLGEGLVCYGRSVVSVEWPRMESGSLGDAINPWGVALFRSLQPADPTGAAEEAAYGKWLDQTSDREEARSERIHGAEGVIPTPVWIGLFLMAAVVFLFMLFFADSGERALVQGVQIGSVVAVIVTTLFVIRALDNPFHGGIGGLEPKAMERALDIIDQQRRALGIDTPLPCDVSGLPLASG